MIISHQYLQSLHYHESLFMKSSAFLLTTLETFLASSRMNSSSTAERDSSIPHDQITCEAEAHTDGCALDPSIVVNHVDGDGHPQR